MCALLHQQDVTRCLHAEPAVSRNEQGQGPQHSFVVTMPPSWAKRALLRAVNDPNWACKV